MDGLEGLFHQQKRGFWFESRRVEIGEKNWRKGERKTGEDMCWEREGMEWNGIAERGGGGGDGIEGSIGMSEGGE